MELGPPLLPAMMLSLNGNVCILQDTWDIDIHMMRLVKLLGTAMIFTHLFACISFYVQVCWISSGGVRERLHFVVATGRCVFKRSVVLQGQDINKKTVEFAELSSTALAT